MSDERRSLEPRPGMVEANLRVLGASGRAACFSALRAGFRPSSIDLFADRDLSAVCQAVRVEPDRYPGGLADAVDLLEPTPWLYTGALENHPELVDRIAAKHRLLGNPGLVLRKVRDPTELVDAWRSAGLEALEVRLDPGGLPLDGSWLVKPQASAGGRGIRPWSGGRLPPPGSVYYQRRVDGLALSALFVGQGSRSELLGITRQFVGKPGNRFAYRGTLAPWPVIDEVAERVERIGRVLAFDFGLRGLFGVDLILKDQTPWPIEVNPRYTAAVEALEWATGRSLLLEHAAAFAVEAPSRPIAIPARGFVAKVIVHAGRPFVWPEEALATLELSEMPEIADVPTPGTTFRPGDPVSTVLAAADDPRGCLRALASRVRGWRRRLSKLGYPVPAPRRTSR